MRSALALAALATLLAGAARAEEPTAKCSLRVILAKHEGGEYIDPAITKLRPFLEREPFDDWKHFTLSSAQEVTLAPHATVTGDLPNNRKAIVTYVEHLLSPTGKHRVKLRLQIERTGKSDPDTNLVFVLDEGGTFLQALQKKQTKDTEMTILGVSCEIPH